MWRLAVSRRVVVAGAVVLLAAGASACGGGDGSPEELTPVETSSEEQLEPDAPASIPATSDGDASLGGFTLPEDVLLSQGSRGDDVVRLQEALIRLGYDPGDPNGTFGAKTRQAVLRFQRENDLDADGIVGPMTAAAIDEALRNAG